MLKVLLQDPAKVVARDTLRIDHKTVTAPHGSTMELPKCAQSGRGVYLDRGEEGARALGAGLLEHLVEEALDSGVLHVVLLVDDREDDAALGRGDVRLVDCELCKISATGPTSMSRCLQHPRHGSWGGPPRTLPWTMRVTIR